MSKLISKTPFNQCITKVIYLCGDNVLDEIKYRDISYSG